MQHKQGRDGSSVPVTPEVAVHRDGGLRRPAQEAARPASDTDATTALEDALSARVAHIFYPPPPPPPRSYVLVPLDFRTPVTLYPPPTYLSTARP